MFSVISWLPSPAAEDNDEDEEVEEEEDGLSVVLVARWSGVVGGGDSRDLSG